MENIFAYQKEENDQVNQVDFSLDLNCTKKIDFYVIENDSILLLLNVIPSAINYSFINGNYHIQSTIKVEINICLYSNQEIYKIMNKFDIIFSKSKDIENMFSLKINDFQSKLLKQKNKRKLIEIKLPLFDINRKRNKNIESNSNQKTVIYYSMVGTKEIIDIINEIKNLIMNKFHQRNTRNGDNDNELLRCLLNLQYEFDFNIQNIDLFLTKFNLPLLLLTSEFIKISYPFAEEDKQIKIETKIELKHLCYKSYNVINQFLITIIICESDINFNFSPIQATLTSLLLKEILSEEKNDSSYLDHEQHLGKIYIKNETGTEFKILLVTKEKKRKFYLQINHQAKGLGKYITLQKYEPEICALIDNKYYYFSIDDLYSPIFLNENLIATLQTKNGINTICFSTPFMIQNKLPYNIDVIFTDKNGKQFDMVINSYHNEYITFRENFSLSSKIEVSVYEGYPSYNVFNILDFNSADLFKLEYNNKFYYSTYFLSFDKQSSICSIIFEPYITITNYIPIDLLLTISDNEVFLLKENQTKDISFLNNDNYHELKFSLVFGAYATGEIIKKKILYNFNEEVYLLNDRDKKIGKINFRCTEKINGNKKKYLIEIYAPIILKNESNIPLYVKENDNISFSFINKIIFYSSESINEDSCFIKLPIYCQDITEVNSTDFEYLEGFSQVIPLKHILKITSIFKNTGIDPIYYFAYFESHDTSYKYSSIITIHSYMKVINDTDYDVIFMFCQNNLMYSNTIIHRNENIILKSNKNGIFDVGIQGYQSCKGFNFFVLGSSVIRLVNIDDPNTNVLLKLTVKKENGKNFFCCYISSPEARSHILIINKLLNKNIRIYQHFQERINGFNYHPMIVQSNKELIFAKEQPFLECELKNPYNINVYFGDETDVHIIKFYEDINSNIIDSKYLYVVEKKGSDDVSIVFYDLAAIRTESHNSVSLNIDPDYSFTFKEIEISYIDNEMHEIFLFAIKNALLKINNKIEFTIGGLALNDMYSPTLSPVVLHGLNNNIFSLEIHSRHPFKNLIFDNIVVKIEPIRIFVDIPFIGDFYASFIEIVNILSGSKNKNNGDNFLFNIFSADSISINKIGFNLFPSKLENRKYRFKHPDYFNLSKKNIPFIKEINYEFEAINHYNVKAPIIDYLKSLCEIYKKQISLEKVIFNSYYLKNTLPSASFDDYVKYKDDHIMQYPKRMPRPFIKGKVLDAPSYSIMDNEYPDLFTSLQYYIQKSSAKYMLRDEKIHEIFDLEGQIKMAFFDNHLIVIFPHASKKLYIKYKDIKEIKNDSKKIIITKKIENKSVEYDCNSEQNAKALLNKINHFVLKINLSEQFI